MAGIGGRGGGAGARHRRRRRVSVPNWIGGGGSWRPRGCGRGGGGIRSRRGGRAGRTGAETRTGFRHGWGGRTRAAERVGRRGNAAGVRHGGRGGRTGRYLGRGLRADGPQAPGGLLGRFRGGARGAGRRRGAVARTWRYDAARRARTGGAARGPTGRGLRIRTVGGPHRGAGGGLRGRGAGGPPSGRGTVAACLAAGRRRCVRETGRGLRRGRGQRSGVSRGGHTEVREVGTGVRGADRDAVRIGRRAGAARRVRGGVGTQFSLTLEPRRPAGITVAVVGRPGGVGLGDRTGRRDAVRVAARSGRRAAVGCAAAPWPGLPIASAAAPRRPALVRGLTLVARRGRGGRGAAGGERVEGFRAAPGGPHAGGLGGRVQRGVGVGRGRGGLLWLPVRRALADRRGLGRARWDGGVLRVRAHAPPVSSRPGRLPVRGPSSLRSTARRRICPSRTRIPVRMDRHPGAGCAAVVVPPYVRVTLRVAPAGTGTSPRARGICPERPPTLR